MQAGIYQHYKGGYYQVIGIGAHTETDELMVAYISLSGIGLPGPRLRFRPLEGPDGWNTPVPGGSGGGLIQRFRYIGDKIPMADVAARVDDPMARLYVACGVTHGLGESCNKPIGHDGYHQDGKEVW